MNPTDWIVLKFGGTSVSRRNRWDIIGQLMRKRMEDEQVRVLVVVSAMSGVTNTLQSIIEQYAGRTAVQASIDGLIEKHRAFCLELEIDADKVLSKRFDILQALVSDARRDTCELSWQAEVLAQGELLSSTMGVAYLCTQNMDVHWCDARDGLKAVLMPHQTAWAQRLSVSCDYQTQSNVEAMFPDNAKLFITQGFIARHPDGNTAILGRGGSDTSAAYFGALLKARRVEIWTDVPGMFSASTLHPSLS